MTHKFEYRHEDMGDRWAPFEGRVWSWEDVATTVAEEHWDCGDHGDANDFNLIVEVRDVETPDNVEKFNVTADYSVNFYARSLRNEETK